MSTFTLTYWALAPNGKGTEVRTATAEHAVQINKHIQHCAENHIPIHSITRGARTTTIYPTMSVAGLEAYKLADNNFSAHLEGNHQ